MALLSADAIKAAKARKFEDVEVAEWGGVVRVAEMTSRDRDELEAMAVSAAGERRVIPNFRAELLARCLVDEGFNRLFTTPDDVKQLGDKPQIVLNRLFEIALRLNQMAGEQQVLEGK